MKELVDWPSGGFDFRSVSKFLYKTPAFLIMFQFREYWKQLVFEFELDWVKMMNRVKWSHSHERLFS